MPEPTTLPGKLAGAAIKVLLDRKGFEWWWVDIDPDDRREIKRELGRELTKVVDADRAAPTEQGEG